MLPLPLLSRGAAGHIRHALSSAAYVDGPRGILPGTGGREGIPSASLSFTLPILTPPDTVLHIGNPWGSFSRLQAPIGPTQTSGLESVRVLTLVFVLKPLRRFCRAVRLRTARSFPNSVLFRAHPLPARHWLQLG